MNFLMMKYKVLKRYFKICFLLSLPVWGFAQSIKEMEDLANRFHQTGDYGQAAGIWKKIYNEKEKSDYAFQVAENYYLQRDYRSAASYYLKIRNDFNKFDNIIYKYAKCLKQDGQYDAAIKAFKLFLKLYEGSEKPLWEEMVDIELEGCSLAKKLAENAADDIVLFRPIGLNTGKDEFAAAEFVRIKTTNLRKVALGVDLQGFNPENRDHKLRKELLKGAEYLLVHCGRMSPEKEPARSVQAVSELVKAGVNVRLIIVGGGPLWNKIRKQSLGLPIEMLGYVASREKVAGYLAAADIAIAPGPLETFCLSALESLASGTPVVASKSSAVGEILNINSIRPAGAVASDNGADFAIAITQLLNKGRLRKVAREQAEKFSWANTVDAMLDVHGAKQPMVTTKRRLKVA